jgi:hypothetical protein
MFLPQTACIKIPNEFCAASRLMAFLKILKQTDTHRMKAVVAVLLSFEFVFNSISVFHLVSILISGGVEMRGLEFMAVVS